MLRGGARHRGDEPCVVDELSVVGEQAAAQAVAAHGGRHLDRARRSAIERGIWMTRNAPHLVKAMPQLVPLLPEMSTAARALVRFGFAAGDGLRKLAGTPSSTLPRSRRIDAARAIEMAPTVRRDGLERRPARLRRTTHRRRTARHRGGAHRRAAWRA